MRGSVKAWDETATQEGERLALVGSEKGPRRAVLLTLTLTLTLFLTLTLTLASCRAVQPAALRVLAATRPVPREPQAARRAAQRRDATLLPQLSSAAHSSAAQPRLSRASS